MKKNLKQQEQLNLLLSQEDIPANHFQSQERERVKTTLETSGQKCLDLSKNSNLYGFLQKMLKDTSNWAWMKYYMTWKVKTTPHKHLLFQLLVSVRTTKGKGYGLWATPNTMDHLPQRSKEALIRQATTTRKGRTRPVCEETMKLWRTPTTMDIKKDSLKHATKLMQGKKFRATGARIQITLADEVMVDEIINSPELMEQYKDYEMVTRKNLPEQQEFVDYMREQTTVKELFKKTGIKRTTIEHWFRKDKAGFSHPSIKDWEQIKPHLTTIKYDKEMTTLHSIEWKQGLKNQMWPTPTVSDTEGAKVKNVICENGRFYRKNKKGIKWGVKLRDVIEKSETTGTLNPMWVEWLMGFNPLGWTDLKHSEIQSFPKLQKSLERQLSRMRNKNGTKIQKNKT